MSRASWGEAASATVGASLGGCRQHPVVPAWAGEARFGAVRLCGKHWAPALEENRNNPIFPSLCGLEACRGQASKPEGGSDAKKQGQTQFTKPQVLGFIWSLLPKQCYFLVSIKAALCLALCEPHAGTFSATQKRITSGRTEGDRCWDAQR